MKSEPFCHLHVHTEFSLLDGACRVAQAAKAAQQMGMPAVAITDHGNLFGVVPFYHSMRGHGVKPIIGYEAYFTPESRHKKEYVGGSQTLYHLTLLSQNKAGYSNLLKMSSLAYIEGFYYKPRVDWELLADCSEGLICLSGCLQSRLNQLLLADAEQEAERWACELRDLFGEDRFFVELQDHGLAQQRRALPAGLRLAKRLGIPTVASNDVHYMRSEDKGWHDVMLCINTGKTLSDPKRFRLESDQLYFKTAQEMAELFREAPEAIANTVRIAEMCEVRLDDSRKYPSFHLDGRPHEENPALLRELCQAGLQKRYGALDAEMAERLNHELDVIEQMGYVDYFLINWDFVRYARERNIPVGIRGSGVSSLVGHALDLTDINPLDYDLLFSRFLDPERREPPDIDIDLCEKGREEVIEYARRRYGAQSTAQIISFGTLGGRSCVRDVGRVLDVELKKVDRIAKLIPHTPGMTLQSAVESVPELEEEAGRDEEVRRILDYALSIEGQPRHSSIHAAGVVIADQPLWELVPLHRNSEDGSVTTQWPMNDLAKMGMLKIDFLGLRTLTIIGLTLEMIAQAGKEPPDLEAGKLDLEDRKTLELLCAGRTRGVFQLGSEGMQQLLRRVRPSSIEDLIAVVGLYRPGPLQSGMLSDFVERKHGLKPINYPHPAFEPILKPTYGLIVYQEQIMRIVNTIAGMSMADALTMIKAIGKKEQKVIQRHHEAFVEGAVANGVDRSAAEDIFGLINHFAGYGFNKAHTSAYAFVAYRTAYLKANYPTEFMAASMSCEMNNTDQVVELMQDCAGLGVEVLPPDINESGANFTVVRDGAIRFGLGAIKNVGIKAVQAVVERRQQGGPFRNLFEFCERVDGGIATRSVVEALMKAGCFDSLPGERAQQLAVLDTALKAGARMRKNRMLGQRSLFGPTVEEDPEKRMTANLPEGVPPLGTWQLAQQEHEALGLYVRYDPLEEDRDNLRLFASVFSNQLEEAEDGAPAVIGGLIESVKLSRTRDGRRMAVLKLLDVAGSAECVVFPGVYERVQQMLEPYQIVLIEGTVGHRRGSTQVKVDRIIPLRQVQKAMTESVVITVCCEQADGQFWSSLRALLEGNGGTVPVYLELVSDRHRLRSRVGNGAGGVEPSERLARQVEELVGEGRVTFSVLQNGRRKRSSGRKRRNSFRTG